MPIMPSKFTLTPIKLDAIPPEEDILSAARDLLTETASWDQGKLFPKVSEHDKQSVTFDQMWDALGVEGPINEKQYMPDITKTTLIKAISPTQGIWTTHYSLPPPCSRRVFTQLRVFHLDQSSPRTAIIVQLPIDVGGDPQLAKYEETAVKGQYTSVERLLELENGKTEWRMATCGTPGGNIPSFITNMTMPDQIAGDVRCFVEWSQKKKSTSESVSKESPTALPSAQNVTA